MSFAQPVQDWELESLSILWNPFIPLKLGSQLKIRFAGATQKARCLMSSLIIEFFKLMCLVPFLGRAFGRSKPLLRFTIENLRCHKVLVQD